MGDNDNGPRQAQTHALRQVLADEPPAAAVADYLFLEDWEREPFGLAGVTLRIGQIRRANPALAAAIRAEFKARAAERGAAGLMLMKR